MPSVEDRDADLVLFSHVVGRPEADIELDVAALLIGSWEREIDVAGYMSQLDGFADMVRLAQRDLPAGPHQVIRAINDTLFGKLGFRGDQANYYDPTNSFLSEVIDRRRGIPITLSVLYMEIARRLDVEVHGIGFPGHFLVGFGAGEQRLVLDPFHMGLSLDEAELTDRLRQVQGADARLHPDMLEPSSKQQILVRMLNNLALQYRRAGDPRRVCEALERMHLVVPSNTHFERELEQARKRVRELN